MKQLLHSLFLAALLPTAFVKAETFLQPLLPDGKNRPYRAKVLLLGDMSKDQAKAAQDQMQDWATLYQLAQPPKDPKEIQSLLSSAEGRQTMKQNWHAILIPLPEGGTTDDDVTKLLKKSAGPDTEIVWPQAPVDSASLVKKLNEALLKQSTPWAELPPSEKRDPAKLLADEDSLADPDSLPLVPAQTATVYRAEAGQWQFNLHSFITHHQGKFWAIWSSGRVDEDSPSQFIRYATSEDGMTWSTSAVAAPDPDGEEGPLRWLASGLYVEDGKLYALGCLNKGGSEGKKIWTDAKLMRLQWTGTAWQNEGVFADNCMVYFPPMKVAGRDFFVWRDEYAHFFTARSLPTQGQWQVKKHPGFPPDYRMSETSAYTDANGVLHLIIRDQGKTRRLYRSLSYDQGDSWTIPVKTNYPDAISKNASGRLSNGWFYLINNSKPGGSRDPLTISVSQDGWTFSKPKILRRDSPARRYPGQHKNDRSFQYADAMEHDGKLWVIYSTNKEDIEVSAYRLEDL